VPTRTWRRDARILLLTTLPFALVVGGLMLAAQSPWVGGWEPLTLVIYAVGVAALWAAMVVCYLVWIVIREGWQASSLPAAVLLVLIAAGAGAWGFSAWAEERACQRAFAFYGDLPALTADARRTAIREAGRMVTRPSICGVQGLTDTLLPHTASATGEHGLSDEERWGLLAELLDAGLPPEQHLLFMFGAYRPDPEAVRLLLARRAWLNARNPDDWPVIPDGTLRDVLDRAGSCNGPPPDSEEERHRAVARVILESGGVEAATLPVPTRERLACLGLTAE